MTRKEIFGHFMHEFRRRKFIGGLLPSLIDFLLELGLPREDVQSFEALVEVFPQQSLTAAGKHANTLIVQREDGSTLSIRPFYNQLERFFRSDNHRHDYPSCAPHATQAWRDYAHWLDSIVRLPEKEMRELRAQVIEFVLKELPDRAFDPTNMKVEPPTFRLILEGFDFKAPRKEPNGAAFQGAVFGFIRADNPHLQVEIDKLHTGSKRLQRVGDVDAWDGERLAITAEVKYRGLEPRDIPDLTGFINAANERGAIGLIVAMDFTEEARQALLDAGVKPLTLDDLVEVVQMWDPAKQRIAAKSMAYHAHHVEKNSVLADRLTHYLRTIERDG